MPAFGELPIPFPLGGLTKESGYQSSHPQTTRGALNVIADESQESRTRGGSRPGLTKVFDNDVLGEPLWIVRVSIGGDDSVPEYLVVGTIDNIWIGKYIASGMVVPVTYQPSLGPLSGILCTEDGEQIFTESGPSQAIIIAEFDFSAADRSLVTQYKGTVVVGSTEEGVVQTGDEDLLVPGGGPQADLVAGKTRISDPLVADWTILNINPSVHWIELISTTVGNFISGTYLIESITTGYIEINQNLFISTTIAANVEYTVRVGVREVDPVAPTVSLLIPTAGVVPSGCNALQTYKDRLVWGCGRNWYMSRQGDPGDYDYFSDPEDPARAIAGTASDAGQPADPIVALATAGYDYLIIFSEQSTWIMRGDPGYGGQLYNLSQNVGCVGPKAWCNTDTTEVYFLAKDGLFMIPGNAGGLPVEVSPEKLPRELRGTDRDNNEATLVYDPEDNVILIFITPKSGSNPASGNHFAYDMRTESFWPVKFGNNNHQPTDAISFAGSPTRSKRAVLACLDGWIRDWYGADDDSTPISSHVIFGPYPFSSDKALDGVLAELVSTLDEESGLVTAKIYVGRTSEEASNAAIGGSSPNWTQQLPAGRSWTYRPRKRGVAYCIRLESVDQWAFEGMFARLALGGRVRR